MQVMLQSLLWSKIWNYFIQFCSMVNQQEILLSDATRENTYSVPESFLSTATTGASRNYDCGKNLNRHLGWSGHNRASLFASSGCHPNLIPKASHESIPLMTIRPVKPTTRSCWKLHSLEISLRSRSQVTSQITRHRASKIQNLVLNRHCPSSFLPFKHLLPDVSSKLLNELTSTQVGNIKALHIMSARMTSTMPSKMSPTGETKGEVEPAGNPIDNYREHVAEILAPIVGLPVMDIVPRLQTTLSQDKGDLMLAVPSLRIKGKSPGDLAVEWAGKFPSSDLVEHPIVSGTFLQFFYKPKPLMKNIIKTILRTKQAYGSNPRLGLKDPENPSLGKKTIIVEFSSPNIAKPFHAGHLRSTIIGGFIANLYETAGWNVIRMNYLGDWGRQYGLLANAFELYGDEEKLKADPIAHLFDIYVEINKVSAPEEEMIKEKKEELKKAREAKSDTTALELEISTLEAESTNEKARKSFKRLEDGDPKALETWRRFRDLSIDKYKKTYARLNIHYDQFSGESQVEKFRMDAAAKRLKESGVSEDSDGAVVVDLTKDPKTKKLGKALVQKKDGSSLYLTRDIGEAVKRDEIYHFDKMIYVVAAQQDLHLAQLFKILELMGHDDVAKKCQHVNFGMVLGMSTRRGTVKFLDDILRDAADRMHSVMKGETEDQKENQNEKDLQRIKDKYSQLDDPVGTADILGISAVMVQDMTGKRYAPWSINSIFIVTDSYAASTTILLIL